jgi:hypothetical protein
MHQCTAKDEKKHMADMKKSDNKQTAIEAPDHKKSTTTPTIVRDNMVFYGNVGAIIDRPVGPMRIVTHGRSGDCTVYIDYKPQ